jgi:eukaryotic-like serine/threonine-protein kinase
MATFEKPKPSQASPLDLLAVIRESGVLPDRQLAEIKAKVLAGAYPNNTAALVDRLLKEDVLTEYQAKRLMAGKSHGLVVGRYVILERLGSGSMGRVYKAHHKMMDRFVAIKIIAPEIVSNEKVVGRFQREMKLVGRLDHPNVIRAFDADQINRVLYIVMEYVNGQSLAQRLRRGTIPPVEMVEYGAQAALGLAHAHAQGIVHRDIKPSNLLLTDEKQIKVLDLGLGVLMEADSSTSFATADGIAVGTVDYMSPEQACGREVDGRSDLYSLGCSMYHVMTGALPFPGDSPIERMGKRISGRPVPINDVKRDLPSGLVRVMDRLLASKPQDRYQSATEAAEALQALLRPKNRPAAAKGAKKPSSAVIPPPRLGAPETVIVKITPEYPGWFRPFAGLAERKPALALASVALSVAAAFGLGVLAAWLVRRS